MRAKFIDYAKKLCKWSNLEISYGLLMPHEMLSQFELVFSPSRFTHTFTNSKTALVQQNMQTRTLSGLLYHARCHHRPMAWERSGVQAVRPVIFGKRGCFTCARSSLLARRLNTPAPMYLSALKIPAAFQFQFIQLQTLNKPFESPPPARLLSIHSRCLLPLLLLLQQLWIFEE